MALHEILALIIHVRPVVPEQNFKRMDIEFDGESFTLSGITIEEYSAIKEMMKLAKLTTEQHKFRNSMCNTSDPIVMKLGCKLSDQIRDYRPARDAEV